ncbi:MAG: hypothetical protein JO263_09375, partial [Candidatus Eremiobacteraeota bacterium]|nr:hypothetical protein [Candidatus Eremiobacteraeota bacterium]
MIESLDAATVSETLAQGQRFISVSPSARADAMLLLAHVLARSREWMVAHPEARISRRQRGEFATLCKR